MHLNGSDENGHVLQGQDAVYENNKQWHDTAFPSYLQSKKDDFCLNWEEAMQVRLLAIIPPDVAWAVWNSLQDK